MSCFNCPLSESRAEQLTSQLGLTDALRILDAGCGNGEFLIRAVRASGAIGLGIDRDQTLIDDARERAAQRSGRGALEFRCADMREADVDDEMFDVAICLGSTHAFEMGAGAYPAAISALSRMLVPGGRMLIGETYWKRPPCAEYLQFLGDPAGVFRDHAENVTCAEALGVQPWYAAVSSDDEWDHFEWSHTQRAMERAEAMTDATAAAELVRRRTAWRNAYLRWGRATMGFGFYVFRAPVSTESDVSRERTKS